MTRLTGKKPAEAIRATSVTHSPFLPAHRVNGLREPLLDSDALLCYLYAPGELEDGRRRATDPVWSLTIHTVREAVRKAGQPALYYLNNGPTRGFVRDELLIVPPGTALPPDRLLIHRTR